MNRIINGYREGKTTLKQIENLHIKGKGAFRALLFSILLVFVLAAPIATVIIILYFQYSPVMTFYWILSVIAAILLLFINSLSSIIYIQLLQNYFPEVNEIQHVRLRSVFIKELFSPLNLIIILVFIFILIKF